MISATNGVEQYRLESYQLPPEKLGPWKISWLALGILMILGGTAVGGAGLAKTISLSRGASISLLTGGVLGGSAAIYFQRSIYNIVVMRISSSKLADTAESELTEKMAEIGYSSTLKHTIKRKAQSSASFLKAEERVRYLVDAANIESVKQECLKVIAQFRNSSRYVVISSIASPLASYIIISECVEK